MYVHEEKLLLSCIYTEENDGSDTNRLRLNFDGRYEMTSDVHFYDDNPNYRLIEYLENKDDDLYVRLCGIEQCLPGKQAGPGERTGYHLHAVIAGKGKLRVGEYAYEVHQDQLFLTVPGIEMWYQADEKEPWYYCWTTFEGKKAWEYLKNAGFSEECYLLDCHIETTRFLEISQEMLSKPDLNLSGELFRLGQAYRFLSLAIESYERQNRKAGAYGNLSTDDYVRYAIKHIQNNYANLQIKSLADYIGLNRTYFTAVFKEKMYMSPQEYLMHVRMKHACELLRETDLAVRVIASSVGYENALTFSKVFRQKNGVSPLEYRRKNKEK